MRSVSLVTPANRSQSGDALYEEISGQEDDPEDDEESDDETRGMKLELKAGQELPDLVHDPEAPLPSDDESDEEQQSCMDKALGKLVLTSSSEHCYLEKQWMHFAKDFDAAKIIWDDAEELGSDDVKFFKRIYHTIRFLGKVEFVTVPLTCAMICSSYHHRYSVWWLGVAAKTLASSRLQVKIKNQVEKWVVQEKNISWLNDEKFLHLTHFCKADIFCPSASKSPLWFLSKSAFFFLLSLPEFADMDLDAASVCNAVLTSTPTLRTRFRVSWQAVPLVGKFIGELGLAKVMGVAFVSATIYQTYNLHNIMKKTKKAIREWPKGNENTATAWRKRFLVWSLLGATADCSYLAFCGELFQEASIDTCTNWDNAEETQVDGKKGRKHTPPGRGAKFVHKIVVETAPQLWFQVCLVSHIYDTANNRTIFTTCVSVVTSVVFTLKELGPAVTRIRTMWDEEYFGKAHELAMLLWVIFFLVTSIINFAGVWVCPDHVLSIRDGCAAMTPNVTSQSNVTLWLL